MTPLLLFFGALLLGAGLIVSGVYVLAGLGWALLAGGIWSVAFASLIQRGMNSG